MFIQYCSSFRLLAILLLALISTSNSANATTLEWDFSQAGDYSATGATIQSGLATGTVSNAVNPQIIGSWGADASAESLDVVVLGQYAYIARGSLGLSIVNISTPSMPIHEGSYNSNGIAQGIAIQGDYAYITDGGSGLLILNISTPASPAFVGSLDTTGTASAVAVKGNYAYVADLFSGLHVIDISAPATPLLKTTIPSNGGAQGVAIQGNYAYVADWTGGLQIVDISAPLTAYEAGVFTDSASNAYDVTVRGDYAYVADGSGTFGQFRIFDISNPAMPTLEGADLSLSGNAYDVAVISHYAYVTAGNSGLLTFDISSPSNPILLNEFDSNSAFIDGQGVFLHGDEVYIADGTDGLHIVNPNVGLSDVRPVSGSAYNQSLISFEETLGANNVSIIHYQLLKDGTAYYHDDSNWALATNETQTNTADEINQHAASFFAIAGAGNLSFKAFFAGDAADVFELGKVTIEITPSTPATPTIPPNLQSASDLGISNSDDLTSGDTLSFDIACSEAGNMITIYSNKPSANTNVGTHICIGTGVESITATSLLINSNGHLISYTESKQGNESAHSPSLGVFIASPPSEPACSTAPNPASNGTAITTSCINVFSGMETLATVTIPNMVCTVAGINASCTGTVGSGISDVSVNNDIVTVSNPAGGTNTDETTGLNIVVFGNCNGDNAVDILDVICTINIAKTNGAPNGKGADTEPDNDVDADDVINAIGIILAP